MTVAAPTTFPCPRCGSSVIYGQLACPSCGALVYSQRLNEIAAEAQGWEHSNPTQAAMVWQQALPLLPPDSQQYRMVAQRIGALTTGLPAGYADASGAAEPMQPPPGRVRPP